MPVVHISEEAMEPTKRLDPLVAARVRAEVHGRGLVVEVVLDGLCRLC
jgi:hypothetical protein